MPSRDLPEPTEVEFSLFGPGLGESTVIHIGDGRWVVIDSCRVKGRCVPADYLADLGVDLSTDVVLVVATHAHDDHIGGISELYRACTSARLALPNAASREEFATLLELDKAQRNYRLRVFSEYEELFSELNSRQKIGQRFWLGSAGRILRIDDPARSKIPVAMLALTPSDEDFLCALADLKGLLPLPGAQPRQISVRDPNHFAMAVAITIGSRTLVLGSDVLRGDVAASTGWAAVVASHSDSLVPAELVKVSHHGSDTGHHDVAWDRMAKPQLLAALTPFRRGSVDLPTPGDIVRLKALANSVWITAGKPKLRGSHQKIAANVAGSARGAHLAYGETGQIRARADASDASDWRIDVFDPARSL